MRPFFPEENYIFHVHTFRCRHAENVDDEAYILKAVELGSRQISFTDHAPFPGDPYPYRMDMRELDEYFHTLKELRQKYEGIIRVDIALEIEYYPAMKSYYEDLYAHEELDYLIIGQHYFMDEKGRHTLDFPETERFEMEAGYCTKAVLEAMDTGLFPVIAHPDRMFRRKKTFSEEEAVLADAVIRRAAEKKIFLEQNLSSLVHPYQYRKEFWEMVPEEVPVLVGTDAHALRELEVCHRGARITGEEADRRMKDERK